MYGKYQNHAQFDPNFQIPVLTGEEPLKAGGLQWQLKVKVSAQPFVFNKWGKIKASKVPTLPRGHLEHGKLGTTWNTWTWKITLRGIRQVKPWKCKINT